MPPTPKQAKSGPQLGELEQRAAARGYTIEQEDGKYFAALAGTRWGPMQSLDELDEFLPAGEA